MGTFNVTSSEQSNQYTYSNGKVAIDGKYSVDALASTPKTVGGSVFTVKEDGSNGDYIGNFNGNCHDGSWKHSLSEMTCQQAIIVYEAIAEIEVEISGSNGSEEEVA